MYYIHAHQFKEMANFWNDLWHGAGCPPRGVLHQIKRSAKSRYRYEVRRLLRREHFIRREKLAASIIIVSSDPERFWKLVHRTNIYLSQLLQVLLLMGCVVLIKFHNCSLLNYRIFSTHRTQSRDSMLSSLSATLSATDLNGVIVSEECIDNAFARLKRGKSDGTSTCSKHLCQLFIVPLHFYLLLVLVPIPKGNEDPTISDNYRPISLAPALSKALEWCILLQFPQYFAESGLQFGFKAKMSTTLCFGAVKNVLAHYMHERSSHFACFLDASKALILV